MSHPVTTAILKQDLKSLEELAAKHEKELDSISSKFENAPETKRKPHWESRYYKWQFVPEEGDHKQIPLETAARTGWLPGVKVLLDHGASARHSARLSHHDPPCAILWACKEGHADVVKLLLERGADIECTHGRGDNSEERNPLKVALDYGQLDVLKVLLEFGANINQPINQGNYSSMEPPLYHVCHQWGLPLFKYLIGAGAEVENPDVDWSGYIGLNIIPGRAPKVVIEELLILFLQAGKKISVDGVIGLNQDWYDHMGGGGREVPVPEELQAFRDGKLYTLTVEDRCRIETRRKLIKEANGRSILPAIKQLPIPNKMKNFIAFGCLAD